MGRGFCSLASTPSLLHDGVYEADPSLGLEQTGGGSIIKRSIRCKGYSVSKSMMRRCAAPVDDLVADRLRQKLR